jgi:16S rRNA (cytosine967-C5)-methyltransferase
MPFNEGEYADKVVARALKKDKRWGSSDRKFVAETIYEIVMERLYEIADKVKEPLIETICGECSQFGPYLEDTPIPDCQLEGTPERK